MSNLALRLLMVCFLVSMLIAIDNSSFAQGEGEGEGEGGCVDEPGSDQHDNPAGSLPAEIHATICPNNERDFWLFQGTAGMVVVADINTLFLDSSLDSYIWLYRYYRDSMTGDPIVGNNDYQGSKDPHLEYLLQEDGEYYIVVESWVENGYGPYILRIFLKTPVEEAEGEELVPAEDLLVEEEAPSEPEIALDEVDIEEELPLEEAIEEGLPFEPEPEAVEVEFEGELEELPCPHYWEFDDDAVGLWYFSENGGTTAANESGLSNAGTAINGAQLGGCSLTLEGVSQYVSVPDTSSLDENIVTAGELTVEAWIRVASLPTVGNAGIVAKWGTGGIEDDSYQLLLSNTGRVTFYVSPTDIFAQSADSVPLNQWVHVAGQWRQGEFISVSVNDAESVSAVPVSYTVHNSTEPLMIGQTEGQYFHGEIDEVRISIVIRYEVTLEGEGEGEELAEEEPGEEGPSPQPTTPSANVCATASATASTALGAKLDSLREWRDGLLETRWGGWATAMYYSSR